MGRFGREWNERGEVKVVTSIVYELYPGGAGRCIRVWWAARERYGDGGARIVASSRPSGDIRMEGDWRRSKS